MLFLLLQERIRNGAQDFLCLCAHWCPQVAMAQLQSQQLAAQVAAIRAQARLQQPSGASAGRPVYSAPQHALCKHHA